MIKQSMFVFLSDICSSVVVLNSLQIDQKTDNKSTFIERSMGVAQAISANPDVKMWCIISSVKFYFSSSKFLTAFQDLYWSTLPSYHVVIIFMER